MRSVPPKSLDEYLNADSSFIDYARFEDSNITRRTLAQKGFIDGTMYAPIYSYPKLDALYDQDARGRSIVDKKNVAYKAILELEARKGNGEMSQDIYELYAGFHESGFKKILLVEAARKLRVVGLSSANEVAREEFMLLNTELYGEMDKKAFSAIMRTEQQRLQQFIPAHETADEIKQYLQAYFNRHTFSGKESKPLSDNEMKQLREAVNARYAHIFEQIPDTPDDVYYDANECAEILRRCMTASGLSAAGWTCEINASKSNPATGADSKTIFLPLNTRRNANELKRLYLHEGEVHARRALRGERIGIAPLEKGTANYADVEEGLGVLLECIVSGDIVSSPSYQRARDRYIMAGLGLGTDGIKKDGRASYELMWRLLAIRNAQEGMIDNETIVRAKLQAMQHADNAYRGTNFIMPGIMYTKLKVYYEGLMKNIQYLRDRSDDINAALDEAFLGKHDHTDPDEHALVLRLATKNTQFIR